MHLIEWLKNISCDADPARDGFQPQRLYVLLAIAVPAAFGVVVGVGLRTLERFFGRGRAAQTEGGDR